MPVLGGLPAFGAFRYAPFANIPQCAKSEDGFAAESGSARFLSRWWARAAEIYLQHERPAAVHGMELPQR